MPNLKHRTLQAIGWNSSISMLSHVFVFALNILLARLIAPESFGLVAIATVLSTLIYVVQSLGLNEALIQKKVVADEEYSSVFWIQIFAAIGLVAVFIACTSFISSFYENRLLVGIIPAVLVCNILASFSFVHDVILQRKLAHKKIAISRMLAGLLAGIFAVVLAFQGWMHWALVAQLVLSALFLSLFLFYHARWKPSFTFNSKSISHLSPFAKNLLGSRLMQFSVNTSDDLIIGKVLGASALGLYSKAYQFLFMPVKTIKGYISTVLFASLSKIQEDKSRVKQIVLKLIQVSSFIIIPLMLAFILSAENFVLGFLGDQWIEIIPMVKIFALAAIPVSILFPEVLFQSQAKTKLEFKTVVLTGILTLSLIIFSLKFGLIAIAIAAASGIAISKIIQMIIAGNLVSLNFLELSASIIPTLLIAGLLYFSLFEFCRNFTLSLPHYLQFGIKMSVYLLLNYSIHFLLKTKSYKTTLELIINPLLKSKRSK